MFGAAGPGRVRLLRADHGRLGQPGRAAAALHRRPRHPRLAAHRGTPEPLDLSQAQAGDLVFIPGADGTTAEPGHVGIVIGYVAHTRRAGRDLYLVQAPGYANLPVELTEATNWLGQIVAVRHLAMNAGHAQSESGERMRDTAPASMQHGPVSAARRVGTGEVPA